MAEGIAGDTFTANEAACITDVPLKEVHRIIDRGLLDNAVEVVNGGRVLQSVGLLALKLAHETKAVLTLAGRRRLVGFLLRQTDAKAAHASCVSVDLKPMRDEVQSGVAQLQRAREEIVCDPAIMGGAPCIRGTRIPAHDIAEMLANGDSVELLLRDYSWISKSQVEHAVVYAHAYPRRGRPPGPDLDEHEHVTLSVVAFDDLPKVGS